MRMLWALPVLVGCALIAARADDTQTQALFKSDATMVVLHATVFDASGQLRLDLPKSAFHVSENGQPQEIKVFRQEDAPVSMGLIVDSSASMEPKRAKVASAALDLIRLSNPDDEVFIMNFSEQPTLERDFTHNMKDLEAGLHSFNPAGGTAMRDALRLGIEHLRHHGKEDKKVLLVVTDGDDNSSVETLDHLVEVAQQQGVLIYAVGLLSNEDPVEAARSKRELDALTKATGGQAYYPKELADIDAIAPTIAHEVRSQYTIAYSPTNQAMDGTFRKIDVKVDGGFKVRTRAGYYASKE